MLKKETKIKKLLTPDDLQAIGDLMGGLMDKQAAVLASKQDLKDLEKRTDAKLDDLKVYMNQGFEAVMEGIDAIAEKLAEKEKVELLMAWAKEVGNKLGIKVRQ